MNSHNYILLLIGCLIISSCSKESNDDSKTKSTNIPQKVSVSTPSKKTNFDTSKLNSVCDCYKEALSTLDEILLVRNNFNSFEEYNKDNQSVKQVKNHLKEWREIQSYCLQTFKRAMYWENDCYPTDSVEKKRLELNDLGIKS